MIREDGAPARARRSRLGWALGAASVIALSAAALALIASTAPVPSALRDPLWTFAQPGTTVWWLALGGPFQTGPSSAAGIAFAAFANAALWLGLAFALRAIYRRVRRSVGAPRGG